MCFVKVFGIGLSCAGAAIMVAVSKWVIYEGHEDEKKNKSTEIGGLMAVIGSCLCMAVYYNFQKPMLQEGL